MEKKDQNDLPKIDYIEFENLPVLSENELSQESISQNIMHLTEVPKWEINFKALLFFRSLNKQNSQLLKATLPHITQQINKLAVSIRSGITKLTLIFLGEVLRFYKPETEEDFLILNQILSMILHGTLNPKPFIRNEAKTRLIDSIAFNKELHIFRFCIELIDLMKNDKPIFSDTAFEAFESQFGQINLDGIEKGTFILFCDKIDELYNKKREIYTKKAVKILSHVIDKITKDKFNSMLTENGKEEKITQYENWIKYNEKKNTSTMSFKDFKKTIKKKKI